MNAVQFLLEEHQKVRQRFQEIEQSAPQQRATLWQQLQPELKIHEEIEDTYLYGPLSRDPAAKGTKLASFEQEQDQDVAQLEQKIRRLHQQQPTGDAWLQGLRDVRDTLMQHVQEEEQQILPQVAQVWDREKLDLAGQQMAQAKQEAMQNPRRYATLLSQQVAETPRSS